MASGRVALLSVLAGLGQACRTAPSAHPPIAAPPRTVAVRDLPPGPPLWPGASRVYAVRGDGRGGLAWTARGWVCSARWDAWWASCTAVADGPDPAADVAGSVARATTVYTEPADGTVRILRGDAVQRVPLPARVLAVADDGSVIAATAPAEVVRVAPDGALQTMWSFAHDWLTPLYGAAVSPDGQRTAVAYGWRDGWCGEDSLLLFRGAAREAQLSFGEDFFREVTGPAWLDEERVVVGLYSSETGTTLVLSGWPWTGEPQPFVSIEGARATPITGVDRRHLLVRVERPSVDGSDQLRRDRLYLLDIEAASFAPYSLPPR